VLPARDEDGYLRILDAGAMPFPADVLAIHEERLRTRAENEGIAYGHDLAVSSVYEISEPLQRLLPFPWSAD
jgi:methylaspartate mutase epsilon subunit